MKDSTKARADSEEAFQLPEKTPQAASARKQSIK